jgi:Flp pilus assembly CpaF family ATPase
MHPLRMVVGEVRSAEAFELSRAVNAGSRLATAKPEKTAIPAVLQRARS